MCACMHGYCVCTHAWVLCVHACSMSVRVFLFKSKTAKYSIIVFPHPGAGFGTYLSVDFALVMDVLRNKQDHAKDIAVWHQVSLAMPYYITRPMITTQATACIPYKCVHAYVCISVSVMCTCALVCLCVFVYVLS